MFTGNGLNNSLSQNNPSSARNAESKVVAMRFVWRGSLLLGSPFFTMSDSTVVSSQALEPERQRTFVRVKDLAPGFVYQCLLMLHVASLRDVAVRRKEH